MCIVFLDDYKSHVYQFVDEHKLDRCLIGLYLFFCLYVMFDSLSPYKVQNSVIKRFVLDCCDMLNTTISSCFISLSFIGYSAHDLSAAFIIHHVVFVTYNVVACHCQMKSLYLCVFLIACFLFMRAC